MINNIMKRNTVEYRPYSKIHANKIYLRWFIGLRHQSGESETNLRNQKLVREAWKPIRGIWSFTSPRNMKPVRGIWNQFEESETQSEESEMSPIRSSWNDNNNFNQKKQ